MRDAFFSLARDASALAAALAQPTGGSDAVVHELRRRSGLAVAAAGTTGESTVVLQIDSAAFLPCVHPVHPMDLHQHELLVAVTEQGVHRLAF